METEDSRPEGPSGSRTTGLAAFRRAGDNDGRIAPVIPLPASSLERRLHQLAGKWLAQSRHPQNRSRPGEAALLAKHAQELLNELGIGRQA